MVGSAAGVVTGRAVAVGRADEASIAGLDLAGAVAVATRDDRRFGDKLETVSGRGRGRAHRREPRVGILQRESRRRGFDTRGVGWRGAR